MSFFSHKKDKSATIETPVNPENPDSPEPMNSQIEQPIPAPVAAPEAAVPETSTSCTTSAHLMSYPLVKETVEFIEKIPGVESINGVSKPVVEFVQGQSMLKPVIETVDKVGNYTLDLSDSMAPCLKTVAYEDIANTIEAPFIAASDAIQKSTEWTTETVQDNVYSPSRQMIKNFRSYYNEHFYDTKGKPLLRSSMDPLVRPVNNYMESLGNTWLPASEPLEGTFSSEIEKSIFLSYDLTKRSIPVVMNKKLEVIISPYTYTVHAIDVFNKNLAKEAPGSFISPLNATYNSTIDLASEAWSTTLKTVGFSSAVEEPISEVPVVEQVAEPVVETATMA